MEETRDRRETSRRLVQRVQVREDEGPFRENSSGNAGKENSKHMEQ